jgi:hypothetical protein
LRDECCQLDRFLRVKRTNAIPAIDPRSIASTGKPPMDGGIPVDDPDVTALEVLDVASVLETALLTLLEKLVIVVTIVLVVEVR